jgi:hypothetical protein
MNSSLRGVSDLPFYIAQNEQQFPEGQWPVCFTFNTMNSSFLRVSDLSVSHCTECTGVCWGTVTCLFHIAHNEQQFPEGQ